MTTSIQGYCDDGFTNLKKRFQKIQPNQPKAGSALVVMHKGETLVNLYTGMSHIADGELVPWQPNTLSMNFSCGKGVLATLVHILVSEGVLAYDEPIANYWQAFGQNGKDRITLRHVLTHQSGLFNIKKITETVFDVLHWQNMLSRIETMTPDFAVNTKSAYQAITFGWLVGGTIEKATGQPLMQVLQEKLLKPLQIENDFFFGVPDSELHRVARVVARKQYDKDTVAQKVAAFNADQTAKSPNKNLAVKLFDGVNAMRGVNTQLFYDAISTTYDKYFDYWADDTLQKCIPAFNGVFTASAMAKIYAMLANGGSWQGHELISKTVFEQITPVQNNKLDQVFMMRMGWRLGYHRALTLTKKAPYAFGHSGINASMAWCDPSKALAFVYVHNFDKIQMGTDFRIHALTQDTLKCVECLS